VADYEREIERNRRWNFAVNVADLSFFHLAGALLFPSTILPLYASYLTGSAILIGLIPAINEVSSYLPQILMARRAEAVAEKKPFVLRISVVERLPYLVIALVILLWRSAPAWIAYGVLALGVATARVAGGMAGPAWRGMIVKVIAPDRRGTLLGAGYAAGGLLGIGGAWVARRILAEVPYPVSFGLCFALAFGAHAVSWAFVALNREPARAPQRLPPPFAEYLRELPALLRERPGFARFLAGQALLMFGGLATSFYVIYGRRELGMSDAAAAGLTMAALASQSIGTPLMGRLSDRFGHTRMNSLAAAFAAGAALLMLLARSPAWLPPAFVLMNLGQSGVRISQAGIAMEFGGSERAPTFSAVMSTVLAVPTLLAPLAGGWAVDAMGFKPTFAAAAVLGLAGMAVVLFGVADLRVAASGRRAGGAGR
jgi:MFS family permease